MTQGREAVLSTLNPQLYTIPATSPATAGAFSFRADFFGLFLGFWAVGAHRLDWFCLLQNNSAQKVKRLIYSILVFFYTLFLGFWAEFTEIKCL